MRPVPGRILPLDPVLKGCHPFRMGIMPSESEGFESYVGINEK
jgi:hypothetical protein